MRKITLFVAVALMSLALSAPAFGASATEDAYGGAAGTQQFSGDGNEPSAAVTGSVSDSGTLPFTGLELALMAAAGIGLVGTGIVVRRASRTNGEA
ncbi:MAG TPA: hypothetical protein VF093_04940 [Solirubrobacterales bacterium]